MKLAIEVVSFAMDVTGPGPRQHAPTTKTFSQAQKPSMSQRYTPLIELDTDLRCIRLMLPGAEVREEILVPLELVVQMEPAKKKPATKAA